jgi:hypothetical protein
MPTESDKTTRQPIALVAAGDMRDPAVRAAFAARMADAAVDAVNHRLATAGLPPLQEDVEGAETASEPPRDEHALPAHSLKEKLPLKEELAVTMNSNGPIPADGYEAAIALVSAQYTAGAASDPYEAIDTGPEPPPLPDFPMTEELAARYRAMLGLDDPDVR